MQNQEVGFLGSALALVVVLALYAVALYGTGYVFGLGLRAAGL